ncbi:DUF1284 domain-containing protein [Jannaschia sp. W003]|uniref:DUF1284 domain-containing protein n=1 Tax=Jannaschia sp. W003 TaxID=2867012 RepID=UPI0021A42A40|nr:DUF1284 domain-containing protein [Jannaschia sp. W003]UWQ20674.1 DUF1284 domain-containing protein [Jannaschia sp. W003]
MTEDIALRPHHVLCAIGFRGRGYDDGFVGNMARVVGGLRAGARVWITGEADAICAPCPRRRGAGCEADAAIARLDAAHSEALGIAPGERHDWTALERRAAERVVPEDLDRLCEGCRWLPLGLCRGALAELRAR